MADDTLSLQIRLEDQATAVLKILGTTLEGLAKSAGTATAALQKQVGGAQGGDPKATGEAVAAALRAQMVDLMTQESRPGGALNPTYG